MKVNHPNPQGVNNRPYLTPEQERRLKARMELSARSVRVADIGRRVCSPDERTDAFRLLGIEAHQRAWE